jgi:hypothetical protein
MQSRFFEVGDLVTPKTTIDEILVAGKVFTVENRLCDGFVITLKEVGGTWSHSRFEALKLSDGQETRRVRIDDLLSANNRYLEEARAARRETESLRLTLAAVEAQRDHLAAVVALAASGNLKEIVNHLISTNKDNK